MTLFSTSEPASTSSENRLYCLDGLRGALALLVTLGHLDFFLGLLGKSSLLALQVRVPAFFALSGFVLFLSSASRDQAELKTPFRQFATLRLLRLVPVYYAALLLAFALPHLLVAFNLAKPGILEFASGTSLFWHFFFLHSWFPEGEIQLGIISPTWMMGYEVQLSLLVPLFLAIVRRVGWLPLLVGAFLLGLPGGQYLNNGFFHPSLTFSFLAGIAAARLSCHSSTVALLGRDRLAKALALFCLLGLLAIVPVNHLMNGPFLAECLTGGIIASACALMTLTPRSVLASAFSWRPLCAVGSVAFSLFLVHHPILRLISYVVGHFHLEGGARLVAFLLAIPVIVIATLLFYYFVERPLVNAVKQHKTQTIPMPRMPIPSTVPTV